MRFLFKTLEKQLEESGFETIAHIHSFAKDESQVFGKGTMEKIGEALNRFMSYHGRNCREVYLQIRRPEPSFGSCNCKNCLKGYEVRVYVGKT